MGKLIVILLLMIFIMWVLGKAFESDLKDLEKTNPKYRQKLKDDYGI